MHYSAAENILWALGFTLNALLLVVIIVRRDYRNHRFFCAWMLEALLASGSLFFIARYSSELVYSVTYWLTAYMEVLLQIAVGVEFAQKALLYRGQWIDDTKKVFVGSVVVACVVSLLFAVWVQPLVRDRESFYLRVDLFASLLVFAIATSAVLIAYRSGSIWNRNEFYRLGGFIVWSASGAVNDTLHAYWRAAEHYAALGLVETGIAQGVIFYWTCLLLLQRRRFANQPKEDIDELSLFNQ